ncbi:hypothetical protein GsuE55_07380 [Geobacillus subterraneus]|uniref:Uncharacterized protein n=1 Tax=Geobacillus subterraneus TaxID=129338 RepID=A0A679FMV6_9BACL|nr:hypothetical protein GsuE55_07380 [Geobacillus subterraneus]
MAGRRTPFNHGLFTAGKQASCLIIMTGSERCVIMDVLVVEKFSFSNGRLALFWLDPLEILIMLIIYIYFTNVLF